MNNSPMKGSITMPHSRPMAAFTRAAVVLAATLACLVFADTSRAEFGVSNLEVSFHDPLGTPMTQAGGHPDLTVQYSVNTHTNPNNGETVDDGQTRHVVVDLPLGFYGNPQALPACPRGLLLKEGNEGKCPKATQVGTIGLEVEPSGTYFVPLYNVAPGPGESAVFGASFFGVPINIVSTVAPDGHIRTALRNVNQGVRYLGITMKLWGVPADPVHDAERGVPSGADVLPLLTLPSRCGTPLTTRLRASSWQNPDQWVEASDVEVPLTGCELQELAPRLSLQPGEPRTHTPSAYDVVLDVPQDLEPVSLGTPPLRKVTVKLPQGVNLSPAAASGLGACPDGALGIGTEAAPACPEASKVGSVSVTTPLLPDPMEGSVYLGTPTKDALIRLFLVIRGPGVLLKVPGTARPDSQTGQITAVFDELPELPFSRLHLRFKGGPRAALTTPKDCGSHTTEASFTSWGGRVVTDSSTFDSGAGEECGAARFKPELRAGSLNPLAGATSPFVLRLQRGEGDGELKGLTVQLPPGLSAYLKGVPYCPDVVLGSLSSEWGTAAAELAGPSCPAASRVGSVTVGAGQGSNPFYLETGKAYLAGPYKGAPLSLAIVTPALAGPFDLGNVVVRTALLVNPQTAAITAISDPLPTILQGIPLSLRDIQVNLDRPAFSLNPTNCSPMAIAGQVEGTAGESASVSDRYQVAGCGELGFKPKLSLRLEGKTSRSSHPALTATLKARKGDANIGKAVVTLPKTQFLEQGHIRTICTRVQYAAENCPKASIYGYAKAWTPLLDKPLRGPVYLRSSSNTLPDLVADLGGQIEIDLAGRIDSVDSRMRTTFWAVPDAPVTKFVLRMQGGKKGLLVNNTELCEAKPRAKAEFTGQNGKRSVSSPLVKVGCGKGAGRRK
jgi:hypothetical protein